MGEQKRCCKCGELLSIEDFYSSSHYADGVLPWCAECDLEILTLGTDEAHQMMKRLGDDYRESMRLLN